MRKKLQKFLKKKYSTFLVRERNLSPLLYFVVLAYLYIYSPLGDQPEPEYNRVAFFSCIVLAVYFRFNALFVIAPFAQEENGILAWVMFAICAFSCNKKWKALLLLFAGGIGFIEAPFKLSLYGMVGATFICMQIWSSMVFDNWHDNASYFTGFFAVGLYYGTECLKYGQVVDMHPILVALLVLALTPLAWLVIHRWINAIIEGGEQKIRSSRVLGLYLNFINSPEFPSTSRQAKLTIHVQNCSNKKCFDKRPEQINFQFLVRQLYENAFNDFLGRSDSLIVEDYIKMLVMTQQMPKALWNLNIIDVHNFFDWNMLLRAEGWVQLYLNDKSSALTYEKQYEYALIYDTLLQRLAKEINEVIKEKIRFWSEVGIVQPRMSRLQEIGYSVVDKMYELNCYYNSDLKECESIMHCFDGTILYGMYLLMTTSFSEYAQKLIKDISKHLETIDIDDNHLAQTFAIHAHVTDQNKCNINEQLTTSLAHAQSNRLDKQKAETSLKYQLLVDDVSVGCCKMLRMNKADIVGHKLNTIIPVGYKEVHMARLTYLLNFEQGELSEIEPSKVLHAQLKLPVRGKDGYMVNALICIKYLMNIEKGLMFMSTIKRCYEKTKYMLLNLEGEVTESEDGIPAEIHEHSEFQKYVRRMKQEWQEQSNITAALFTLMIDGKCYSINISSPLLVLFHDKRAIHCVPPLHVAVQSEQDRKKEDRKRGGAAEKGLNELINVYMSQEQDSTESSETKSSPIRAAQNFVQNNYFSDYKDIFIAFFIVLMGCLMAILLAFLLTSLEWDNTSVFNNPISDIVKTIKLNGWLFKSLNLAADINAYRSGQSTLNLTKIQDYYGTTNYEGTVQQLIGNYSKQYRSFVRGMYEGTSEVMAGVMEQISKRQFSLFDGSVTADSISQPTQTITFTQLASNYEADLTRFSQGQLEHNVLMFNTMNSSVIAFLNTTSDVDHIDKSLDRSSNSNLLIISFMAGLILVLLVPVILTLRKRAGYHIKVFDIISSLDFRLVKEEIESLGNVLHSLQTNPFLLETKKVSMKALDRRNSAVSSQMVLQLNTYQKMREAKKSIKSNKRNTRKKLMMRKGSTKQQFEAEENKYVSIIRNHAVDELQVAREEKQAKIKWRKRAGELDVTGTESDRDRWFVCQHWALYLLVIVFVLLLGLLSVTQGRQYSRIKQEKQLIVQMTNSQAEISYLFLMSKIMLRDFGLGAPSQFTASFALDTILSHSIFDLPQHRTYSSFDYSSSYEECAAQANSNSTRHMLFCRNAYSYRSLQNEFASLLQELIQNRLTNSSQHPTEISQRIFYLQSVLTRMQELIDGVISILFDQMVDQSISADASKQIIMAVACGWFGVCLVVGLALLMGMRLRYFKEIYMITFLNQQMVLGNKRVESFLVTITKNSK